MTLFKSPCCFCIFLCCCIVSLNIFNHIALMVCILLNKTPGQQLHARIVNLCPHESRCIFQTDKDNSVPTQTTFSVVWREWQQWHQCNNLIRSQRIFCGKQKCWDIIVHYRTLTITTNLITVNNSNCTGYTLLTEWITVIALF